MARATASAWRQSAWEKRRLDRPVEIYYNGLTPFRGRALTGRQNRRLNMAADRLGNPAGNTDSPTKLLQFDFGKARNHKDLVFRE